MLHNANIPVVVTVEAATAKTITVPATARRMVVHSTGAAGGTGCVITLHKDGVASGGSFAVATSAVVSLPISGLAEGSGVFPNQIHVDATTTTSLAFECENPETLIIV